MKPTEREKKCIDYSSSFKTKYLEEELVRLKQQQMPLFASPKYLITLFPEDFPIFFKEISWWGKILFILLFFVLYLIIVPLFFFARLFEIAKGDQTNKKNKIELINKYKVREETSSTKTFSQLWTDHGLQNLKPFTSVDNLEEQRKCIYKWFSILYNRDSQELNRLVYFIEKEMERSAKVFYKNNPRGHVTFISIEKALPKEIDRIYGPYDIYEEELESRDDMISALRNLFLPQIDEDE